MKSFPVRNLDREEDAGPSMEVKRREKKGRHGGKKGNNMIK